MPELSQEQQDAAVMIDCATRFAAMAGMLSRDALDVVARQLRKALRQESEDSQVVRFLEAAAELAENAEEA